MNVPGTLAEKNRPLGVFHRSLQNPLLRVQDLPFQAAAVLNPGAAESNGETTLLLRVEDIRGYSRIHVARSRDGIADWRIEREPLLNYGLPKFSYEALGCGSNLGGFHADS